jgi:O-antigen/teichoic acid export membrane protein
MAGMGLTLAISAVLYWEGSLLREYGSALLVGVGCVPLLAVVNTQSAIIRSKKKIGWATISTNVLQPVGAVLLTYLFLQFWRATGGLVAITAMAVTLAALCVLQWVVVQVFYRPQMRAAPSFRTRRWMAVALPLLVIAGFQIVLNRTDVLMVGTLLNPAEVGKYSAALRTGGLISFVLTGFNAIAAPLISQYWSAGDLGKLREAVEFVIRWTLWSSLVLVIGMSIAGEYILALFGTEFTAAYWTLIIISLGQFVNACAGPVGYIMALTGHERTSAKVYGAMALINVPLNYVLIIQFGSIGAAVATTLTLVGWNLALVYLTMEKVGVSIFSIWKRVLLFR